MNRNSKKILAGFLIFCTFFLAEGCSIQKIDREKMQDIDYEIVEEIDIPEEMKEEIERQKEKEFLFTYGDKGELFIARGYGEQETGGYEIKVREFFETSNAIILKTDFWGPEYGVEYSKDPSCPYIVLKMKYSDKYVLIQ